MDMPLQRGVGGGRRSDRFEAKVRPGVGAETRRPSRRPHPEPGSAVAFAVAFVLLSACTGSDEQKVFVDWTHARLTENLENYHAIRRQKALAGCINWEASTPEKIDRRHVIWYSTAATSVSIFTGELMRVAIDACDSERKTQGSDCSCVAIDTIGQSRLLVPESFIEKLQAANVLATEGERRRARQFMQNGHAAYERDDYDQAIRDYADAIRVKPDYARAFYDRGNAYRAKEAYDQAIRDYDEAIRLDPGYALAFNARGIAYRLKGDHDRAIESYHEAISLKPDQAFVFRNRGIAYRKKGLHDLAIQDFSEAIRLEPDQASSFNLRCWSYGLIGRPADALSDCNESLRLRPDHPDTLDSRALAYWLLGDNDKARRDLERASKIDTSYPTWQERFRKFEEMF